MKKQSFSFGTLNIVIFTLIVCIYLILINTVSKYSQLRFPQELVAGIVYNLQSALGINAALQGVTIAYPSMFNLEVTLLCTGINEILFFSVLVLGFIGVSLKTKLKGYALFFPIIIMENIIRITLIQPLAVWLGNGAALSFHDFSFKYGQTIFVIILVLIWFQCFAKKEFRKSVQNYKRAKRSRTKRLKRTQLS